MSTGKVVLGTLAGVATGGILGILFAPEKGSVTRKKISRKGEDLWGDLKDEAKHLYAEGKEKVQEMKKDLKSNAKLDS